MYDQRPLPHFLISTSLQTVIPQPAVWITQTSHQCQSPASLWTVHKNNCAAYIAHTGSMQIDGIPHVQLSVTSLLCPQLTMLTLSGYGTMRSHSSYPALRILGISSTLAMSLRPSHNSWSRYHHYLGRGVE